MEWATYLTFVGISLVIALTPGADTAVVMKNSLTSGRRGGIATSLGVSSASTVQALLAIAGLGIIIAQSQPVLQAIRWIGAVYLAWMAFQALRSAWRAQYAPPPGPDAASVRGFRQGFLVNITNPQMLLFYLAIFPQFMSPGMAFWQQGLLALTLPLLGGSVLVGLALLVDSASTWVQRRPIRRALDALTGTALGFLSVRVALDRS